MTSHSSTKLTYSDYVRFPDDGLRHEIIGGEHVVTPSPATRHQRISRDLLYLLTQHLRSHPVGEVLDAPFDVVLSTSDIVVPDLVYVSNERARFLTSQNLQGPPDLVVEILSPPTRSRDQEKKKELYERAGVLEYWLVDPERDAIVVYRVAADARFAAPVEYSSGTTNLLLTPLLPGLSIDVSELLSAKR